MEDLFGLLAHIPPDRQVVFAEPEVDDGYRNVVSIRLFWINRNTVLPLCLCVFDTWPSRGAV
jgi:hypothetical protein